ncbi:MAG: hypothetical protein M3Q36_03775 [bacterium]|nr:hypothetical protein [bacterium]
MINRPAKNIVSTTGRFLFGLVLINFLLISIYSTVGAIDFPKLPNRSLTIEDTTPGVSNRYVLSWRYAQAASVGSIKLEMCTSGGYDETCVSPNGDMSAATLFSQNGETGFSINSQSTNSILLTRGADAVDTVTQSTYTFDTINNPSGLQKTFYIRISTYSSSDGTGAFNHFSSVVNATTEPIVINTEVPPILYFCTGLTIDLWCDNVSGNMIDYGNLSAVTGHYDTSQFGVATNALGGYVVTANGNTMTAGTRTIDQTIVPSAFTPGVGQFGMNLRANTLPAVGQDPYGLGISTVSAGYNNPDVFQFNDGDEVASSVTGTLFDIFTVTYIVNIPPNQPSGVYNTTIAYICTAAF